MEQPFETNSSTQSSSSGLTRRELLQAAAAGTVMFAGGAAIAGEDHAHHAHHANPHNALIDSALECVKRGELCLDHCMLLFKEGDTSVADCADSVNEMLAMCGALTKMAAYQSAHLKDLARVCKGVCEDCEEECRKHEDEHPECKACGDACKACAEECGKLIT